MPKHRTFNADKFLDKFCKSEDLLRGFVGLWSSQLRLDACSLDVPKFKRWLVDGEGDAKEDLLEALYQVYDLCTEQGHEYLMTVIEGDPEYDPDPEHALPVECLSLKVRTERNDLFHLASARHDFWLADRFTIYRGPEARLIPELKVASKRFQHRLAEVFRDHKNSDRVMVRHYEDGPYVNFIVYHEKRTRATLIFQGSRTRPKVGPQIHRPAQQDFISYNRTNGQVEIEAGYENEEKKLRRCFAECCFGDAEFFEGADAANCISLEPLANPQFVLATRRGITASLVELKFQLKQMHGPRMLLNSQDVLATLSLNGLRRKLDGGKIFRAAIKIRFPDDRRGKRVELGAPNRIKFRRATHAEDVFNLLMDWGILRHNEDATEPLASPTERHGLAPRILSGNGRLSTTADPIF